MEQITCHLLKYRDKSFDLRVIYFNDGTTYALYGASWFKIITGSNTITENIVIEYPNLTVKKGGNIIVSNGYNSIDLDKEDIPDFTKDGLTGTTTKFKRFIGLNTATVHITKYLDGKLKFISFTNDRQILLAIINNRIWYNLQPGLNILDNNFVIHNDDKFRIEYKGSIIKDNVYNHENVDYDELPIVPPVYGKFNPSNLSQAFMDVIKFQEEEKSELQGCPVLQCPATVSVSTQWIILGIIVVAIIMMLWMLWV